MGYQFHILDVFSDQAYLGNQLAVVEAADDLEPEQMLAITREFGFSETVFLQTSKNPVVTSRLRIFTPAQEIPFAGHPTIGTAVLLAELRNKLNDNNSNILMMLEEEIGIVRSVVSVCSDGASYGEFDAPQLPEVITDVPEIDLIADALGLGVIDIGFENHKVSAARAGIPYLYVPVRNVALIREAQPTYPHWVEAFDGFGPFGVYVYCREEGGRRGFHVRMFAPDFGVYEDPVTGSAAVGFASVIERFEGINNQFYETHISQGVEMGRRGAIKLEIEFADVAARLVRIGGHAVRVAEGTLL